jgi:hypothetical protein
VSQREADPLQEQAADVFAEQLAADRVPSIRARSALSFTSASHVHNVCGITLP